jgi:AraC family transcriptional regulator
MPVYLDRGEFFGRVISAAHFGPFRISETNYARDALLPWHRHEESYVTFVLSGGYRERSASRALTCGAPSIVLHPPGDTHEDDFERPTRCLNVVLGAPFVARLGDAADPLHRGDVIERAETAGIGARLATELRAGDAVAPLMIESVLLELFASIARKREPRDRTPHWLTEVQSILARRFMQKVSLGALASEVGVHPVHLARAFRKHTGASVGERVRALRLDWSRRQLATATPLASIATQAGFSDQSHFTKAFTRAHGIGPAEYRRRLRRSR